MASLYPASDNHPEEPFLGLLVPLENDVLDDSFGNGDVYRSGVFLQCAQGEFYDVRPNVSVFGVAAQDSQRDILLQLPQVCHFAGHLGNVLHQFLVGVQRVAVEFDGPERRIFEHADEQDSKPFMVVQRQLRRFLEEAGFVQVLAVPV